MCFGVSLQSGQNRMCPPEDHKRFLLPANSQMQPQSIESCFFIANKLTFPHKEHCKLFFIANKIKKHMKPVFWCFTTSGAEQNVSPGESQGVFIARSLTTTLQNNRFLATQI